MKKPTKYADDFKESVVKEVLDGIITKEEAKRRYGIRGSSAVLNWIRNFEYTQSVNMEKIKKTGKSLEELEAENARLKQELELEQLRTRALNVMIDIAENQFKIPIRKKPGAKQSKK